VVRARYEENHFSFYGKNLIFSKESGPYLGPNQSSIKRVKKVLSHGLKLSGCETDHGHLTPRLWSSSSYTSSWCDNSDSNFIMYPRHSVHKIGRHTEYLEYHCNKDVWPIKYARPGEMFRHTKYFPTPWSGTWVMNASCCKLFAFVMWSPAQGLILWSEFVRDIALSWNNVTQHNGNPSGVRNGIFILSNFLHLFG
jgi:hypothetical protein